MTAPTVESEAAAMAVCTSVCGLATVRYFRGQWRARMAQKCAVKGLIVASKNECTEKHILRITL